MCTLVNGKMIIVMEGTMTFASGSVYDGEWKDGNKHGKGTVTFADGDVYDGIWKMNKIVSGKTVKGKGIFV